MRIWYTTACAVLVALTCTMLAASAAITVPNGFIAERFASGLQGPRFGAFAPNGDLFVTEREASRVIVFAAGNSTPAVFIEGLHRPSSLAFYKDYLYIGETDSISRVPYRSGDRKARGPLERLIAMPTGGHETRTVVFDAKGMMYVGVGSSCNVCNERDERRAAITTYDANGANEHRFATGLRNAVGLAFDAHGQLWGTVNGRDNLGDDVPPDYVTQIRDGKFYGWPFCYGNRVVDTDFGATPERCANDTPPTLNIQAHSAPLGIAFYDANQFPAEYRGNAFVAYHGSWNRSKKTGYKVVRVPIRGTKAEEPIDFMTGFEDGALGRPVGVIVAPDGSLFVTDDTHGTIWRIRYRG